MITDTPKVKELRQATYDTRYAVNEFRHSRERYVSEAVSAARLLAEKTWDAEYGERQRLARQMQLDADLALRAELDRMARAGEGCQFAVGAKVERWEYTDRKTEAGVPIWKRGTPPKRGVIEIITTDSRHPRNRGRHWSRPECGTVVIRILLATGKQSDDYVLIPTTKLSAELRLVKADPALPTGWFYEGEDANALPSAAE